MTQIFSAKIVARKGIVRRKKADVAKLVKLPSLLAEVRRCSFHLIETGDQYVIICNPGYLKVWC
jgi:hypothetical protein